MIYKLVGSRSGSQKLDSLISAENYGVQSMELQSMELWNYEEIT